MRIRRRLCLRQPPDRREFERPRGEPWNQAKYADTQPRFRRKSWDTKPPPPRNDDIAITHNDLAQTLTTRGGTPMRNDTIARCRNPPSQRRKRRHSSELNQPCGQPGIPGQARLRPATYVKGMQLQRRSLHRRRPDREDLPQSRGQPQRAGRVRSGRSSLHEGTGYSPPPEG